MAATAQMTTPEFVSEVAALCGQGEAAVVFITEQEGVSYCVVSEEGARRVAQGYAESPELDSGDVLLGVAVVFPGETVTEYPVA